MSEKALVEELKRIEYRNKLENFPPLPVLRRIFIIYPTDKQMYTNRMNIVFYFSSALCKIEFVSYIYQIL